MGVEIERDGLDAAGDVLTAATEAGGDDARVRGVRFALEDNDALLDAARERAFEDARSRAEQFDEAAARQSAPGAVPIQPGRQEVQVQVTVVWSLD